MHRLLDWLPRLLAALCLLALLPWLLGVPGVDNGYARGWTLGLWAIIGYPTAYLAIVIIGLAARQGWVTLPPSWLSGARWIAVAGFVLAQALAWPMILGS